MELDNEIESRLSAAQTTLTIQVGQTSWYVGYDVSARHVLCSADKLSAARREV